MSYDMLKKLGIGVAVLVAIWIGSEMLRGGPESGSSDLDVPELTAQEIDSIIISGPRDIIVLARSDSAWTVNGLDAAYDGIDDLVSAVSGGLALQLVGRNPVMHERFEVDDTAARRLSVYRGTETAFDMLVGKQGSDFQSVYVRHPGEDAVFSARTRLSSFVNRAAADWRDKVVAAIETDQIRRVEVRRPGARYTLIRPDSVWMIASEEANPSAASRVVDQFRALNALGFASDEAVADSVDLESPDRTLALFGTGDTLLLQMAFDSIPGGGGFWARRAGNDVVFRMDQFKVNQITPADSTLRN